MENNRRSGQERRDDDNVSGDDKRKGERRSTLHASDDTLNRLKSISIFKGLNDTQLKKMVGICSRKKYDSRDTIYRISEDSNDMFILIKGTISITFSSGVELQSITPTGTVGEMGVFTGEPRSATVVADTNCMVLNFNKKELIKLFKTDMELWVKIQGNVIKDLSHKVRKDNEIIEELMYRVRSLEIL